ncbi:MAG: DUF5683 domain-containing protein [Candidatus Eisenbacteria bacterium]
MRKLSLLLLSSGIALSAVPARADEGALTVKGTPGAHLRVDGRSYGPLPQNEIRLAPGLHEIILERRGYERITEEVHLLESRGETRIHYLHKKRRQDALWRGLVVPGWGVAYNENPMRGALYFLAEAVVLGYAAWQEGTFQARRDDFEEMSDLYRAAVTEEAIARNRAARDAKYDEMSDAERNRDGALVTAAAVYGLSLLDALFAFPFGDLENAGPVAIGPAYAPGEGSAVVLQVRF